MKESNSMQCIVETLWEYNHSMTDLKALNFKDIGKSTSEQVKSYVEMGLSTCELSARI